MNTIPIMMNNDNFFQSRSNDEIKTTAPIAINAKLCISILVLFDFGFI